nr:magnesium-translocating P-type ATPase [Anaerolineae bacterium]
MLPPDSNPYWASSTDQLLQQFQATPDGLTGEAARQRLAQYGPNTLKAKDRTDALRLFLEQFKSPIMLILLVATGISAALGDWLDSLIIFLIVLGSAVLSFFQEYSASNAVEELRARVQIRVNSLRDGQVQFIPAEEIVPGDMVLLSAGSLIPADGVVIEATDCFVNQAVLTGETFPVEKKPAPVSLAAGLSDRTNVVFMGTSVRSGTAKALIVQTGAQTAFGQIAETLTLRPPETEFERGIRRFGYLLTELMLVLTIIVFAINVFFQKPALDSLLFSVALAVGLTPQLLPAIINITLAQGSKALAQQGVIVRHLTSIENFGSMDVLCTDKTGTLTVGVVRLDGAVNVEGEPSENVLRLAAINACFQTGLANPLDEAILASGEFDPGALIKVDEIPYDFNRKRLSVVIREANEQTLVMKGALNNILAVCSQARIGGATQALDEIDINIQQRYADWSGQGFRVLGVASKAVRPQERYTQADEQEMIFEGFLLFFDPPKPDVQQTISDLNDLGVQLKIITGDNKLVALHTAEAVGLEVTGALTGAELNTLSDESLWQAVERANLYCEVDPNQKERIILALKKRDHVVGYMGDGINDAPALHTADVGVSVDTAVDVAKDAADFVLMEQSLAVLRRGIELGRTTFANTLKYVFITTSANFGNMFSMAGASLFMPFLPLLPKQILLINFLTDFPAMTIASDAVDREQVTCPRRWDIRFIRDFMVTFGLISSLFDYLTFGLLLLVLHAGQDEFRSGWFVLSIITELLILLVMRTQKPFFRSKPSRALLAAALAVSVVTLLIPYTPLNTSLGLAPIPPTTLLALLGIAALYITASELAKYWFYRQHRETPKPVRRSRIHLRLFP